METIHRSFKTELDPTKTQVQTFLQWAGCARYVWNWALAERQRAYEEEGKSVSTSDQSRRFTELKREEDKTWLNAPSRSVFTYTLRALDEGYGHAFRRLRQGLKEDEKAGFPKFKARGVSRSSFTVQGREVKVKDNAVRLPKIGWVRLKEKGYIPTTEWLEDNGGRHLELTVSEKNRRWYVAVTVEMPNTYEKTSPAGSAVGIDLGIRDVVVTSDGFKSGNPKHFQKTQKRLKRAQRRLRKMTRGSVHYKRQKLKIAKLQEKVANQRAAFQHSITKQLTDNYETIATETLAVKNMVKNKTLAKDISGAAWSSIVEQLEYKSKWKGGQVVKISRWYPSTKTCSKCGHQLDEIKLSVQHWTCPECGVKHDRDINAAKNIKKVGTEIVKENQQVA